MKSTLVSALTLLMILPSTAQEAKGAHDFSDRQSITKILGFEVENGEPLPTGWSGQPTGTIFADYEIFHSGHWSARLDRKDDSQGSFSSLTKSLPIDFAGKEIQLRGFLRTENVTEFAGLWLREDGDGKTLRFDNMQRQQVRGTTGWTEYSIVLPIDERATQLFFGALVSGKGKVWVDDLELLVDGKPIAQANPAAPRAQTALDRDHDFDSGSRIAIEQLNSVQIQNLATLGRVWGFLKYHHPAVTSGQYHWDYELLRLLPRVLAARSQSDANTVLVRWIDNLGPVPPCKPCLQLDPANLDLKPDLGWIRDRAALGKPLSDRLQFIYKNRSGDRQFYVSLQPNVKNPSFDHELAYPGIKFPDSGFQLLALYRFWNIVQYWSPNRDVAREDWPQVLREFIPQVALAKDKDSYQLALMALIARVHDTHSNLWSSLQLRPPVGECQLPVNVRFVEKEAVVTGYAAKSTGQTSGLKVGDILEQVDGDPVAKLIEGRAPFYGDSNQAARSRDMARSLTRGRCGASSVLVRRAGQLLPISPTRLPSAAMDTISYTHDLPGDTFRLLSTDVAYLKLSSVKVADVPHYIELAHDSKGLIIDIRNYPSEFVVFALGQFLVTQPTPFARFTNADLSNPGSFRWGDIATLEPGKVHYGGKVVILVDEVSVSQAEYTAMAFRSAPNAIVVGSMTAGADGNVSTIPLPGDLSSMISGLGVFYPNRAPTQRVGIHPDVGVEPTIAGFEAGRDEVLEAGIRQILGSSISDSEIERLARP